ncbi:hypothetical protein OEZ71_03930 [Defluviimonas sp. WL0050]|uniref:Uncharacterized protein n=1 Tax=Albidovulum litorale TaxID=2984134 RepID=A0ABT2ZJY5_9RHOB|nr:hypothetical protein [Defluviimonas sp. WL0050]MCV2871440.1 hypothetical protein [Defluviimonas sp. WL0050]
MTDVTRLGLEQFLVEDVIVTLGNIRRTFRWVRESGPGADPAELHERLDRLDRLIDVVETRARDVCQQLQAAGGQLIRYAAPVAQNEIPIELAILDALAGMDEPPLFRSQRR